ncbi:MAG: leucyl aminopeptidase [Alteromonas naphthalenivorans]|jgi:leucyl aminopeptidase
MIKYTASDKTLLEQNVEGFVYFVPQDFSLNKICGKVAMSYFPELKLFMEYKDFTGKNGQTVTVPISQNKKIKHLIFIGLGQRDKTYTVETYRRAMASAVRIAECHKIASLAVEVPNSKSIFGYDVEYMAQITTTISMMADYTFDEFIDKKSRIKRVEKIVCVAPKKDIKKVEAGIKAGQIVGESVNNARHWVDLPANKLAPIDVVKYAKALAKKHDLEISVFDEKKAEKLGMGGLKAVGMGSQHDAQMVIMQYTCKKKNAPMLALVGKGITFDSGGINLKPTGYLETMKEDMSGAAAVINALVAISKFKPNVNVVAVAALAENMVSGNANHPGDIITFYNGKTAVVGNTDAEGRLVLADALAYTDKHFKPTAMVDVATLTGACSHAIGPFFSGLLTQDDKLAETLDKSGKMSGDALWRLPLTDAYKAMVKSNIADLDNSGNRKYYAGATNGAMFLSNFVDSKTRWAHIDIAPSAFDVPATPYYKAGMATGAGTRLLIDFVLNWK